MTSNPFLGVFLHAVGGFAAGSFYAPLKSVKAWAWESLWLIMGLAAWIAAPWTVALLTTPRLLEVLTGSPAQACYIAMAFGLLWGVGNLTFGLSVRYLGMALGYTVALGFCMTFGTLLPPLYNGFFGTEDDYVKLINLFTTLPGQIVLAGVVVCMVGIALCGVAGMLKERELSDSEKQAAVAEFALGKGFAVATMAGILSACFAFGLAAGKPIAQVSIDLGTQEVFSNNAVLVVILLGGFVSNATWCLVLNVRKRSYVDYVRGPAGQQLRNYALSALAGVIWYGQFFFYGMGETKLGKDYNFSSWSIHMAFIIIFSNLWGMYFREWRGTRQRTQILVWVAIATLIASTMVIGYGNYLNTVR
jgi:L-rhamnose-H+ transport protein